MTRPLVSVAWLVYLVLVGTNLAGYYSEEVGYAGMVIAGGWVFFAVALREHIARLANMDVLAWLAFLTLPLVLMGLAAETFPRGDWTTHLVVVLVFVTALLVASAPELRPFSGLASASVVLVLAGANLYELLVAPNTWSIAPGRSAGFMVNPNLSAANLVGYSSLYMMSRRGPMDWRDGLIMTAAFLGVASAFSRSGVLLLAVVFLICYLLRARTVGISFLVGTAFFSVLAFGFVSGVLPSVSLSEDAEQRLVSILGGTVGQDFDDERGSILRYAWSLFLGNFWTGVGVRSSLGMESGYGPHNMYVGLAMDVGVLGLLAYSLLLARLAWGGRSSQRLENWAAASAWPLFAWLAIYSVFSHDLLYDPSVVILIAFAIARPVTVLASQRASAAERVDLHPGMTVLPTYADMMQPARQNETTQPVAMATSLAAVMPTPSLVVMPTPSAVVMPTPPVRAAADNLPAAGEPSVEAQPASGRAAPSRARKSRARRR